MTLEKSHHLPKDQVEFGGSCNCSAARLLRAAVSRAHRRAAVDCLIRDLDLTGGFGF